MKKWICVLMAALMLAGCRSENAGETEPDTEMNPVQNPVQDTVPDAGLSADAVHDAVQEPEEMPVTEKEDALPEPEEIPAETIMEEGMQGEQITGTPTPPEDAAETAGPLTWYLYQYTTGTECAADTVERPEHSGYIQFGSFCEDPWTLIGTYTPAPAGNPYIHGVTDGRYIIRDGDWFLYDAMLGTKEMLDFLPKDAAGVYALVMDTQEIIGYAAKNAAEKWAYYDLTAGEWITDYVWDGFSYSGAGNYITAKTTAETGEYCEKLIGRTYGNIVGESVRMSTLCNDKAMFVLTDTDGIRTTLPVYVHVDVEPELSGPISSLAFSFVSLTEDGHLIAVPSGTEEDPFRRYFQVYDRTGALIHTSGQYGNVLFAYRDWVVVTDSNRLLVLDREENVLADFGKWSRDMTLHWSFSGWKENYAQTGEVPREYKYSYFELNDSGEYIGRIQYRCPDGLYLLAEDESIPVGGLGRAKWYFWSPDEGKAGMLSFSALLNVYTIPEV